MIYIRKRIIHIRILLKTNNELYLLRPQYYGGYYMLQGTKKDGLPPRSPVVHVDVTCKFRSMRQPKTFIAFGPHTHNHGTNVQGFLYRNKQITEIAQHDPQERQMFYPMKKETAIYNSDYIGLKCTFNTMEENRTINFGMLQYRNNLFLFFMSIFFA